MTRTLQVLLSLLFVLAAPLAAPPSSALAQSGAATRYLHGRHDRVTEIMERAGTTPEARTARDTEVSAILSDLLDYEELGRRTLGEAWGQQSAAEQRRFVDLLRQLVERNYRTNLEHIREYEVSYGAETAAPDGSVVHTSARSRTDRRQPPVEIVYTMHQVDGAWRVFDVNTDGSSMVRTYQQMFGRILREHGWEGLIQRMQERLATPAPAH